MVIADAWFSNKTMQTFIRQTECKLRIDGRKNLSVQVQDYKALKIRGQKGRGRKRTKFVTYVPVKHFMGHPYYWKYFTDTKTQERVQYKIATFTLKTTDHVTFYTFKRENQLSLKFILTFPL